MVASARNPSSKIWPNLQVSDKDLYALMRAKVKESNIKLAEADIARIRAAAGPSPYFSPKLKANLAAEYKQILLDKARRYAENGETALDIYADQEEAVSARDAFVAMAKFQATTAGHSPRFYSLLSQSPRRRRAEYRIVPLLGAAKVRPIETGHQSGSRRDLSGG